MRFRISCLIAVLMLVFNPGVRGQSVYIPSTDPVNEDILHLIKRGYLADLTVTQRPWIAGDVVQSILHGKARMDFESGKTADSILERLKAPQAKIPKRLFGDFNLGFEIRGVSRERREGYYVARGRYIDRGFKGELGSVYKAGWWISRDGQWGIDTRLIFDSDGTGYPWYYGTAHNARIVGQFDHAYGFVNLGYFKINVGRQRIKWGPSPRGSLLLDDSSPPLDMVGAVFDLKPFRMSWFTSRLDDYLDLANGDVNNRYLSGHRLTVKPTASLEISLTEMVLYGGVDRLPELYYSIPVVLYYWEAQNRKIDDNVIWAVDGSWVFSRLGRIYLQMVADDIQYESNGPQKWALQVGADLAPSRFPGWSSVIELNFVDTYVFGQRKRRNAYLNWGRTIGRLDSDQLEMFAGLYRFIVYDIQLGAEFRHRQKGEYYADYVYPDPILQDEEFPSGIVEKTNDLALRIKWNALRKLYIDGAIGFQKLDNYRNQAGLSFDQFYSNLLISYSFDLGLPLWTKYH